MFLKDFKNFYQEYLKSLHWRKIRDEKIKKISGKCEVCGFIGNLEVHHIYYKNLANVEIEDLLATCRLCHQLIYELPVNPEKFKNKSEYLNFLRNLRKRYIASIYREEKEIQKRKHDLIQWQLSRQCKT